ncbi:MAG TPA: PEP-CTERM sorting domain-containing protein [Alphaproteobacteria bacterium]|nr:PEP-CTERM sorting domain-containing protein [Alphaproteobacteria bacterium]
MRFTGFSPYGLPLIGYAATGAGAGAKFALLGVSIVGLLTAFAASSPDAFATPCPATPTCTVTGATFTAGNDSTFPDATQGTTAEIDDGVPNGMNPIATFVPDNESPGTISAAVLAYLSDLGVTGTTYLGRSTGGAGSGGPAGTGFTVTSADGGLSGTWAFSPGTTGLAAGFIAIHAGGGAFDVLYELTTPGSLSGVWDTSENVTGANAQGALSNFDLFSGTGSTIIIGGGGGSTPEPASVGLLGTGLAALGLVLGLRKLSGGKR